MIGIDSYLSVMIMHLRDTIKVSFIFSKATLKYRQQNHSIDLVFCIIMMFSSSLDLAHPKKCNACVLIPAPQKENVDTWWWWGWVGEEVRGLEKTSEFNKRG